MKLLENPKKIEIYDDFIQILITKRDFNEKINYFSLKQIHSDKFFFIKDKNEKNFFYKGDAIITQLSSFPIGVRTADCLPIFIYSKKDNLISVVHAGWRSTAKKILEKVVIFIENVLKIDINNLNFIFGPCICNGCYEVKDDMKKAFLDEFGNNGEQFFNDGKFDLKSANKFILKNFDIPKDKIFDLNLCTVCNNDKFYSFRKENTDKRIFNVIQRLKEEGRRN